MADKIDINMFKLKIVPNLVVFCYIASLYPD